jgi:signal transduction histidine kinase
MADVSSTTNSLTFWIKLTYLAGFLTSPGFLYFSFVFPRPIIELTNVKKFLIVIPSIVIFMSLYYSDHIIKDAYPSLDGYGINYGSLYFIYILLFISTFGVSYYNLTRSYLQVSGIEKKQLAFVITGTSISAFFGVVFDIVFPLFGNIEYFWLGAFLTTIMIVLIAYAIIKHHFLNIKIIVTELLVGILALILLLNVFTFTDVRDLFYKLVLFSVTSFIGYLLIKSILKEIEQREKLEVLNKRLLELDKIRKVFLSFASHQVRAPMTVVKGLASMISDGSFGLPTDGIKDTAKKIQDSAERLISLVSDILDLRRIEEGKMEYNFEKVEINKLISEVVEEFKMLAKNKNLKLLFKPLEEKAYIQADLPKFRQVIQNLIDNAIKYTEKGWVKVEIEKYIDGVLFSISDSGRGISPELLPNLFTPFSRDSKIKTAGGTGLGLYISKKIINAHNGKIWAESSGEGMGSIFYVDVPGMKD